MHRRIAAVVTVLLLTLVVVLLTQESNAAAAGFPPNAVFCGPLVIGVQLGGVVTTDVVVLTNTNAVETLATITWDAPDGKSNNTSFTVPARGYRVTTPADVGFTASGFYSLVAQSALLATIQRVQNGVLGATSSCYFIN